MRSYSAGIIIETVSDCECRGTDAADNRIGDRIDNVYNIVMALADVLLHIDGLVEVVSKIIDDQKARFEAGRIETDRKIANAASADANAARLLRKLQKRLLKAETNFINALVDYYYFLLALRAEHDPDARGGPRFDNAEDLAAYLRERVAA